jgi:hypothetical protein
VKYLHVVKATPRAPGHQIEKILSERTNTLSLYHTRSLITKSVEKIAKNATVHEIFARRKSVVSSA